MNTLDVPYFKQDTGYSCGPTALQMVFAYFGVRRAEKDLMDELGANADKGTSHQAMISSVLEHGFFCYVNDSATLEEISYLLSREVPVVVNFIEPSEGDGHYAVVVGVSDTEIVLHDPWNGEGLQMEYEEFITRWKSGDGSYEKWFMAVSKEDLSFGKQYRPRI